MTDIVVEQVVKAVERASADECEPAPRKSLAGNHGDSGRLVDARSICDP